MNTTTIASSQADARAAAAIRSHHAELSGAVLLGVDAVLSSAAHGSTPGALQAARTLNEWCERELVPHALAEEETLYAAAGSRLEARLLLTSMVGQHAILVGLVRELAEAESVTAAVGAARALQVLFDAHVGIENDVLLPVLEAAPDVDLAALLGGMHGHLAASTAGDVGENAAADHPPTPRGDDHRAGGGGCQCGHAEEPGYPELDARSIPHAIRHATIFGALASIDPGSGLVLVAPHDPVPLLDQIEQRYPGRFDVNYLERGPQAWRLVLTERS